MSRKEGGQPGNKNAEKWTEPKALALAESLIEWMSPKINEKGRDEHAANIYISDFLTLQNGLNKDTFNYLKDKFTSFSELLKRAKEIQELKLWKYGTAGKLNPTMTIFALKNLHGYKDKVDVTSAGKELPYAIEIKRRS